MLLISMAAKEVWHIIAPDSCQSLQMSKLHYCQTSSEADFELRILLYRHTLGAELRTLGHPNHAINNLLCV